MVIAFLSGRRALGLVVQVKYWSIVVNEESSGWGRNIYSHISIIRREKEQWGSVVEERIILVVNWVGEEERKGIFLHTRDIHLLNYLAIAFLSGRRALG